MVLLSRYIIISFSNLFTVLLRLLLCLRWVISLFILLLRTIFCLIHSTNLNLLTIWFCAILIYFRLGFYSVSWVTLTLIDLFLRLGLRVLDIFKSENSQAKSSFLEIANNLRSYFLVRMNMRVLILRILVLTLNLLEYFKKINFSRRKNQINFSFSLNIRRKKIKILVLVSTSL